MNKLYQRTILKRKRKKEKEKKKDYFLKDQTKKNESRKTRPVFSTKLCLHNENIKTTIQGQYHCCDDPTGGPDPDGVDSEGPEFEGADTDDVEPEGADPGVAEC